MFVGKAWNNGDKNKSGSGYGIRLERKDRDKYFSKTSKHVFLRLDGQTEDITVNIDKPGFWNGCIELIKKDIGLWFIDNGKVSWEFNNPPELQLGPIGNDRFKVTFL